MKKMMGSVLVLGLVLLVGVAGAKVKYVYMEAIPECDGNGGWEVRDYYPDGSYTVIYLCDGGGVG